MNDTPQVKYGGATIRYSEVNEKWIVDLEGQRLGERASLKEAKKIVDKHGEDEKALKRHTAIFRQRYGHNPYQTVTITSYPENGWRGPEAWVTKEDKKREKVCIGDLFEDNPKNHVLLSEISAIDAEMEELNGKKAKAESKLQGYTKRNIEE